MANPNAFVAFVRTVEPAPPGPDTAGAGGDSQQFSISFDNGQTVRLDPADPRSRAFAEVLEDARREAVAAFVEVNPRTQALARVFFPHIARVLGIKRLPSGDVEVLLKPSSGRHVLNRTTPDFEEILAALSEAHERKATLAITETPNEHDIIDARPLRVGEPNHLAVAALTGAAAVDALPVISAARAQQLFDLVQGKTCEASAPEPPCIPFLYPDDGCWARAHQMCRLIEEAGDKAAKIWNYATDGDLLSAATENHPSCAVPWTFHVAPVVRVTNGSSPVIRVLDPSLFDAPVSVRKWTDAQGNVGMEHVFTDDTVFDQPPPDREVEEDRSFRKTKRDLTYCRLQLKTRSKLDSPPPYKQCQV